MRIQNTHSDKIGLCYKIRQTESGGKLTSITAGRGNNKREQQEGVNPESKGAASADQLDSKNRLPCRTLMAADRQQTAQSSDKTQYLH